ncbi:hypothetical protein D9613_000462 [Agrocybe pediades]|uniref:Stress-response A/B barrel domain-containing protein n=1 Tax=Agrocybe pediades TaxID=84607 RepID=A0A8H4R0X4_9AGAR|nr:hypothetical protein D9613_000462 [Agrocybe pediades]KAF9567987.1 hypothetical protein CPC08DRAFT_484052 [Agrocybe pediades]
MISHIVLVKFTPEATPEQKKMWREEIIALGQKIEQVTETRAGEKITIARAAHLDGGFEDGVILTLADMDAYLAYVASPHHASYKEKTNPIIAAKLVYNIESK